MVVHLVRGFPVPSRDIAKLTLMLRNQNVLVGTRNPSADWYDPMWFAQEQALSDTTFTLLVDRNVYSATAALAQGSACKYTDQHRTAAAALCFAHCCGLRIETRIALLEHELDGGSQRIHVELPRFRRAFMAGPKALADFALGRTRNLQSCGRGDPLTQADGATLTEQHRPRAWHLNYGSALKLASLILDSGLSGDADRLLAYFRWCYDEFFFSAGPTVYGSLAFSPKRKRRMFKRLRGSSAIAAMRGIRNAAWDMTLISEWELRQRELSATKDCYLLCSLDRAVTDVANTVMCQGLDEEARSDLVRGRFIFEWGERDGVRVFETYSELARTADTDRSRPANQERPPSFWNEKIAALEHSVLTSSACPRR